MALDSTARQPKRWTQNSPQGRGTSRPCSCGGASSPSIPWAPGPLVGEGEPEGPLWRVFSSPLPRGGWREEERIAARHANWRRILNCSKMSRGLGASPGKYQHLGHSSEKLAGPAPGRAVVGRGLRRRLGTGRATQFG